MPMSIAGKSNKGAQDGFTLFELLVVMAIVAVAAGLIIPRVDMTLGGGGPEQVKRVLKGALDECRVHARLSRSDVVLVFGEASLERIGGDRTVGLPGSAHYKGLVYAVEEDQPKDRLIINRKGVTAAAIVLIEVGGTLYSFYVPPVLSELEYEQGRAGFEDFAH
jgi:prepilin-type N-terminal cleavage/methylation domain-containing protein